MARRPRAKDMREMAIEIAEGSSLRQAAKKREVDLWRAYDMAASDPWRQHYERARAIALLPYTTEAH